MGIVKFARGNVNSEQVANFDNNTIIIDNQGGVFI